MPWGFRKRIGLGPGVRLNIGQNSVSVTVGNRLARTTFSSKGTTRQSYSIPGTGLYYLSKAQSWSAPNPEARLAPAESEYANAMSAFLYGNFDAAYSGFKSALKHGANRISGDYYAALSAIQLGRVPEAIPHLERVVASDQTLPDDWMLTYAPPDRVELKVRISIVDQVYATLDMNNLSAALQLAELYQRVAGRRDDAIALMNDLLELDPTDEAVRLSLCDLLFEATDMPRLIDVAGQASPRTSLGLTCHLFKQQAYSWLGDQEAAKEVLEHALTATEADDDEVLRVAHSNLVAVYGDLGLSPKRAANFRASLTRKKRPSPKDPRLSTSVVYSNKAWAPGDKSYEPRADPDHPRADD